MGNFTSKWHANQESQLEKFAFGMLVTSKQNESTPGIVQENVPVREGEYYIFSAGGRKIRDVEGTNDFKVMPYIRDADTHDSIYSETNKDNLLAYSIEELTWEEYPFQLIIKIPKGVKNVDLFMLFKDQEIGSQFVVEALSWDLVDIDINILKDELAEAPGYMHLYDNRIETWFGEWIPNHDISHNYEHGSLTVIAEQNNSTPGLRRKDLHVIPGEKYTFTFVGRKLGSNFNVFPYIADAYTGLSIYGPHDHRYATKSNVRYFGEDLTEIKVELLIPDGVRQVESYVLFSDQEIGDKFLFHYFAFDMTSDLTFSLDELENTVQNNNLVAYADKSVREWDHIHIHTSCKQRQKLNYIKYALLDINKNVVKVTNCPNIVIQEYPEHGAMAGCEWKSTHYMNIDREVRSGMYILVALYNNNHMIMPVTITNHKHTTRKIALLSNINTWAAYETWSGYNNDVINLHKWDSDIESEFKDLSNNVSMQVSFNRPFVRASDECYQYLMNDVWTHEIHTHLVYLELYMYKFLKDKNIEYDVLTDVDLEHTSISQLHRNYDLFVVHGHSQYWTEKGVKQLSRMARRGVNLALFGAGAFHWKAYYDEDNNLIVPKNGDTSLIEDEDAQVGLWTDINYSRNYIHPHYLFGVKYNPLKKTGDRPYEKYYDHHILKGAHYDFGERTLNPNYNHLSAWIVDDVKQLRNRRNVIAAAQEGGRMVYNNRDFFRSFAVGTILWNSGLFVEHSIGDITLNVMEEFSNSKSIMFRKSPIDVITPVESRVRGNFVNIDYNHVNCTKFVYGHNNKYFEAEAGKYLDYNGTLLELKHYCFNRPSEHMLNGLTYPMSMNLIHVNNDNDSYVVITIFISEGEDQGLDSSIAISDEMFINLPNLNEGSIYTYPGTITNDLYIGSATYVVIDKPMTSAKMHLWYGGEPEDIQDYNSSHEIMHYA